MASSTLPLLSSLIDVGQGLKSGGEEVTVHITFGKPATVRIRLRLRLRLGARVRVRAISGHNARVQSWGRPHTVTRPLAGDGDDGTFKAEAQL